MTAAGCNQNLCDCKANAGLIMPERQAEFTRFRPRPLTLPARLRLLTTPQARIDIIQPCGYIPDAVHNGLGATLRRAVVSPIQLALKFISQRISHLVGLPPQCRLPALV